MKFTFFTRKPKIDKTVDVPVLCRFWEEDGVWNAEAQDLPVAVFGKTFEQARSHMSEAVMTHLASLEHLGMLRKTVDYLRERARQYNFTPEQMVRNQPMVRIDAAIQDDRPAVLV